MTMFVFIIAVAMTVSLVAGAVMLTCLAMECINDICTKIMLRRKRK